jgi:predicted pyridoxine 5'-phosphate oxidase superfamily flavin-nucleotide-binding protein
MNQGQQLFGLPSERASNKVRPFMVAWVQEFIRHSPFMVMATCDAANNCDASPRGGHPGFVKVLDDRHLLIPDVQGNKLFHSFENLESNPNVGLLFLIPGINASARVNGPVAVLQAGTQQFEQLSLEVFQPDYRAKLLLAFLVTVVESFGHCPRALKFSDLWNTETISTNVASSPIPKWVAGT